MNFFLFQGLMSKYLRILVGLWAWHRKLLCKVYQIEYLGVGGSQGERKLLMKSTRQVKLSPLNILVVREGSAYVFPSCLSYLERTFFLLNKVNLLNNNSAPHLYLSTINKCQIRTHVNMTVVFWQRQIQRWNFIVGKHMIFIRFFFFRFWIHIPVNVSLCSRSPKREHL